jgi:hypothetical protein
MEEQKYNDFVNLMETACPSLYKDKRYGGFAIGEGWFGLIEALSKEIVYHETHLKDKTNYQPVVIEQIKEKFGGLRFYYQGGNEYIRGLVNMAEIIADQTCETCGAPGKKRSGGWIRTLCDFHEEHRRLVIEGNQNA